MMLKAAKRLREYGCKVDNCLVLFEPEGKGAADSLIKDGITLFSIIKNPEVKI